MEVKRCCRAECSRASLCMKVIIPIRCNFRKGFLGHALMSWILEPSRLWQVAGHAKTHNSLYNNNLQDYGRPCAVRTRALCFTWNTPEMGTSNMSYSKAGRIVGRGRPCRMKHKSANRVIPCPLGELARRSTWNSPKSRARVRCKHFGFLRALLYSPSQRHPHLIP